jgi:hypothetical protein
MELYLWNKFCNIVFKIKHNLYAALGSAPTPNEKLWVHGWIMLRFPYTLLPGDMQ